MKNIDHILYKADFQIQEAKFSKIGSIWTNIVGFYPHNRIYLITGGSAVLKLMNTTYHLDPGYMYFVPSYSIATGTCDILEHYYLHFKTEPIIDSVLKIASFRKIVSAPQNVRELFSLLVEHFNKPPGDTAISDILMAEGVIKILLSLFLEDFELPEDVLKFADTLNYIEKNINRPITVKELASINMLNTVYFSNQFTKVFNMPPQQYIISKKIDKAYELLYNENYSVKEISYMLGFEDEAYFSRLFKKKSGMSPLRFRTIYKTSL